MAEVDIGAVVALELELLTRRRGGRAPVWSRSSPPAAVRGVLAVAAPPGHPGPGQPCRVTQVWPGLRAMSFPLPSVKRSGAADLLRDQTPSILTPSR
jgi:hypothetical protein